MFANPRPVRLGPVSPGSRGAPVSPGAIELVGQSVGVGRVQELVRRSAVLSTGALIVAERGCDAASVAWELHLRGRPTGAPWVAVDCGAADPARLDHALFGCRASRAPSDLEAVSPDSRIAAARRGTLYLQDVAELPASAQSRLSRIMRDGDLRINGEIVAIEIRVVASAVPSLDGDVQEHRFRADLYRRLAASRIDLPPLRDRAEDMPALTMRLVEDLTPAGSAVRGFTQAALALLSALAWPGNLAELRGVIERVLAASPDEVIPVEQVLPALQLDRAHPPFLPAGSLREARTRFERDYIAAVLQYHGWRMADAAQTLGIQRPNLYRKARQLGIPVARAAD